MNNIKILLLMGVAFLISISIAIYDWHNHPYGRHSSSTPVALKPINHG